MKFTEYGTAGHLLFLTPWPVTGHIATQKQWKRSLKVIFLPYEMMFLRRSLTSLQRWSVISVKFFILHVFTERRSVPFSNFEPTQANYITGSPSSKYEHRRASALLRNILKYKDLYGKKTYRFSNRRKWKDFNKNSLPYLKCVLRLSCVYRVLCERFSLYINSNVNLYRERKPFT